MDMTFQPSEKSKRIIELLMQAGASDCMFVGGFVRDHFLGLESKDIDIEAYGLDYDQIASALSPYFRVDLVGQSFGVIKIDNEIDVSIPRRESKTGVGHTGFQVETDLTLTPREAFGRRDFTINAIGMRLDGSLCDPYGGREDIERKVLRATTDAFREDPLRVLRGMQFASRFGFEAEERTLTLCRSLLSEFETLPAERLWVEWHKWATKGRFPSKGLRFLNDCGWIEKFPEIAALIGCKQSPLWHPEGDVFEHTLCVCDEAVEIADEMRLSEDDHLVLLLAGLCHDFGKPSTTILNENGHWTAPGHDHAGGPLAERFLNRIKAPRWVMEQVVPLVTEHMAHVAIPEGTVPSDRLVRRLATRLTPTTIRMWFAVCTADGRGCGGLRDRSGRVIPWLKISERLSLLEGKPLPLLRGRDLLLLGMEPGPPMGTLLKSAYEAQLDGEFQTPEAALDWAKTRLQ